MCFKLVLIFYCVCQFSTMEGLVAVIYESSKKLARHKQVYTGLLCLAFFLFGLLYVTHVSDLRSVVRFLS